MTFIPGATDAKSTPLRPVRLGPPGMTLERRADGTQIAQNPHPLGPYPEKSTDRLEHWARVAPDRVFLAQRSKSQDAADRSWRTITYRDFVETVRRVAQGLLDRELSADRPLVVLSGNDIEHALLMYAAMYVGIPYAPVSPAYSLSVREFTRLKEILDLLQPGLIFANHLPAFTRALDATGYSGVELVTSGNAAGQAATQFADLAATAATGAVDQANSRVHAGTIAKILFTSGSTNVPKGVVNTHRMLCSNQTMIAAMLPCFEDQPPVTVDWLPWHHTFGGNHNLGLIVHNGGTLYIDEGRPVPGGFAATVENLREIATTVYLNVPKGFEELVACLRRDELLRRHFFSRIQLIFYAAASLSQPVWNELERLAVETCGERITMVSGFGATETAPSVLCAVTHSDRAGFIGIPEPGVCLKLVPSGDKLEARVRGPMVTPGYWKHDELTASAFDEEGFYRLGDAVAFLDPDRPEEGFLFDGRLAEDFKLSSGTWVSTGMLRTQFAGHCAPFVQDVAIAGHDRDELGALIFIAVEACRARAGLPPEASIAEIAAHQEVRELFRQLLTGFAAKITGSSNRITRAILMTDRPSLEAGEITDKGSLNQRATLRRHAESVEELYSAERSMRVISIGSVADFENGKRIVHEVR